MNAANAETRLRNGVVAVATPRMARRNAAQTQPAAPQDTVLLNGLNHVLRAGGRVAASVWQIRR